MAILFAERHLAAPFPKVLSMNFPTPCFKGMVWADTGKHIFLACAKTGKRPIAREMTTCTHHDQGNEKLLHELLSLEVDSGYGWHPAR